MPNLRWIRPVVAAALYGSLIVIASPLRPGAALAAAPAAPATAPAGVTWYVDRYGDDGTDGDLATHSGTFRFALTQATSGDFVSFAHYDAVVDSLYINETLVVPDGVAVGYRRETACGSYTAPFVNIIASVSSINPVVAVGGGASLSGIDIAGGYTTARITRPDADICGVGLGIQHNGDGDIIPLPPLSMALIVDGAAATIRRNYINGQVVVSTNGSDSRFGDAIGGSGDGNDGVRNAALTILSSPSSAAQRVTVRDPFPRALNGMAGMGVEGGDDVPTHANNWAQTPRILAAYTFDHFASVTVTGKANPFSMVDLFFDTMVSVTRQPPVMAAADGAFTYTGVLPGPAVQILAASTLDDPAHPGRVGSTSQLSAPVSVSAVSPKIQIRLPFVLR